MSDQLDILTALLLRRYGERLSAEQQATLRATLATIAADVAAIHAVPLPDRAEPVPTFVPFRGEP